MSNLFRQELELIVSGRYGLVGNAGVFPVQQVRAGVCHVIGGRVLVELVGEEEEEVEHDELLDVLVRRASQVHTQRLQTRDERRNSKFKGQLYNYVIHRNYPPYEYGVRCEGKQTLAFVLNVPRLRICTHYTVYTLHSQESTR